MSACQKRQIIQTEIGPEIQCAVCKEFWPADSEFFYMAKGKPHSWCKACYVVNPKVIAKASRWKAKQIADRQAAHSQEGDHGTPQ